MVNSHMLTLFEIKFPKNKTATAVNLQQKNEIVSALQLFGLRDRPVISIIGGAGGMSENDLDKVKPAFQTIVEFAHHNNILVVDGGTDSGVMRLLGQTKVQQKMNIPLLGIAASGTIIFPGKMAEIDDASTLEPNHNFFLLVPGEKWGDETMWIDEVTNSISEKSISILVNGGPIAKKDFQLAIDSKRPVVVLAGTGRFADEISSKKNNSHLVKIVNCDDNNLLRQILSKNLKV